MGPFEGYAKHFAGVLLNNDTLTVREKEDILVQLLNQMVEMHENGTVRKCVAAMISHKYIPMAGRKTKV